jgi:nitroreductase
MPDSLLAPPLSPAMETLLSRASVGQLREPAPDGAVLDAILAAGLRAPDHGRLRPWRFVLIRGEARARYAELAVAALRARDPAATEEQAERMDRRIRGVPLIIALGVALRPEHRIPEIEQMLSAGAAAMNLLNAVHAQGFAAIWVTGANAFDPAIAAALGFPAPHRLAGFLYVGTRDEALPPPPPRPSLDEHVREWTAPAA